MRRVVCAVLLVALSAQAPLTPTKELEAKLAELELKREPILETRSRAFRLRVAAGFGYGLALVGLVWGIVEVIRTAPKKATEPLGGVKVETPTVPPLWLFGSALLFAGVAATLSLAAYRLLDEAEVTELQLEEEEGPIRRELAWDKDQAVP